MKMQPRQELLDIWRAVAKTSWDAGKHQWIWGGRYGPNSIADAEQLLCLLMPATSVDVFSIDEPDRTGDEMLQALESLGGPTDIPRHLIKVLIEYHERYSEDGVPTFAGGSYFVSSKDGVEPSKAQTMLDIVDSFAMSVTLSLATIGFVRVFRKTTKRSDVLTQADKLEQLASVRLTAAMVGLLRSFSVNVFDYNSVPGQNLLRMVNQGGLPPREVVAMLQQNLRQTAASFREVLIGSGQTSDLDDAGRLFECGWSWGIVTTAPPIETTEPIGPQAVGVAEDAPYLYFTVVAMDAINDLFSERTRVLGLLNEEQQRLSRALQLRSDLTRAYWAQVATFDGANRWPLEDIPWRTNDGIESEYFSLQVTSLAVQGLTQDRGSDAQLIRVGAILDELANRARITRRPISDDAALALHAPGVRLELLGSDVDDQPRMIWPIGEFAPLLMQRMVDIAGLLNDPMQRRILLDRADRVWDHLAARRMDAKFGHSLWDQPTKVFPTLMVDVSERPSWYFTERVVLALVRTANVLKAPPLRSDRMTAVAAELLNEADQLFDNELMRGTGKGLADRMKQTRAALGRARELLNERPGTAAALASEVLVELDELAAGRKDAGRAV